MVEKDVPVLSFEHRKTITIPIAKTVSELKDTVQKGLGPTLLALRQSPLPHPVDIAMIPYNYYTDSLFFTHPKAIAELMSLLPEPSGQRVPLEKTKPDAIIPQRSHLIGHMRQHPNTSQKFQDFIGETFILGLVAIEDIEIPPLIGLSVQEDTNSLEFLVMEAVAIDGDTLVAGHAIPQGDIISNATIIKILEEIFAPHQI